MGIPRAETTAYRRVVTEEEDLSDDEPETEEEKAKHCEMLKFKKKHDKRKWFRQKAEAFLWVSAACGVLWYGDRERNFFTMLLHNVNLNRNYLYIAYALLALNTCIFLYLAVWVTYVRKRDDWELAAPWAIPAATGVGLLMGLMSTFALWPVYGLLTPFVQGILFMGMLLSTHFMPQFGGASPNKEASDTEHRMD